MKREGSSLLRSTPGIHSSTVGPSSEYTKKSLLMPHSEHVVREFTTASPDGCMRKPALSVRMIQLGRSPVKNTPVSVVLGVGFVVNGIN